MKLKNGIDIIIGRANEDDAKDLIDYVIKTTEESEFVTVEADEFDMTIEGEKSFISSLNNSDNGLFIVAEHEGHIIATLSFYGMSGNRFRHSGEFGMSVLKEYWGLGIGEKLLEYLFQWAKESNVIRKINLKVRTNNERAIKLYNKTGFKIEGEISRDFLIDGSFYNSYIMGIDID